MTTWDHIFYLFNKYMFDATVLDYQPFKTNMICVFSDELSYIDKCLLVEYISETELNIKMIDIAVFRKELGLE